MMHHMVSTPQLAYMPKRDENIELPKLALRPLSSWSYQVQLEPLCHAASFVISCNLDHLAGFGVELRTCAYIT